MAVTEHAPRTEYQEAKMTRLGKLRQRARRIGSMLLPAEIRLVRYQERELPAGSREARLAHALDRVSQDYETRVRARGSKPQKQPVVETTFGASGNKRVTVGRRASVRLNRHGMYDGDSHANIQTHAFAPNPLKGYTDIREYEMTRTTKHNETGEVDVLQLSVTSRPTREYHADGTLKTSVPKDFKRTDVFVLAANAAGQFGAPQHMVFHDNPHFHGARDITNLQEPEQIPGERFDAMMDAIEAIDLAQPGEGTFDMSKSRIPAALISYHDGIRSPQPASK